MTKDVILYTDLEDEYENYVDLFDQHEIVVRPYQLTLTDKLSLVAGFVVLTAIGIGILYEDPPDEMKEYALFGLLSLMFVGIFGGVAWHVFRPHPDYYFNDQGFRSGRKGSLVPWSKVHDIAIDFLGMKIFEKNGKKHRIFIHDADDQYRLNVFLGNLAWLHSKYAMTSGTLIQNLLHHIKTGMVFGKEQAEKVRNREIKYYLSILLLTLGAAVIAAAIIWFFDFSETGELGYSSKKAVILFGIAILVDLFLLGRAYTNDVHKKAQDIIANSEGLDITYSDGQKQKVSWHKMLELWEDPDYGKDGKYFFEIWHSTDGGMLLIHLLPYAADYFTSEQEQVVT